MNKTNLQQGIVKKGKSRGYQEAFVVYDKFGYPKGSSNIEYIVNDAEFKALKIIGAWWYDTHGCHA